MFLFQGRVGSTPEVHNQAKNAFLDDPWKGFLTSYWANLLDFPGYTVHYIYFYIHVTYYNFCARNLGLYLV